MSEFDQQDHLLITTTTTSTTSGVLEEEEERLVESEQRIALVDDDTEVVDTPDNTLEKEVVQKTVAEEEEEELVDNHHNRNSGGNVGGSFFQMYQAHAGPPPAVEDDKEGSPRMLALAATTSTDCTDATVEVGVLPSPNEDNVNNSQPQENKISFAFDDINKDEKVNTNKDTQSYTEKLDKEDISEDVDDVPCRRDTDITQRPSGGSSFFFSGDKYDDDNEANNNRGAGSANTNNNTMKQRHYRCISKIQSTIIKGLQYLAGIAVRFPRRTLIGLSVVSVGMLTAGLCTGFVIETDIADLWPPKSSQGLEHIYWMSWDSWFSLRGITMDIVIHKNTDGGEHETTAEGSTALASTANNQNANVLGLEGVARVFEVYDIFTNMGRYKEGCAYIERYKEFSWAGRCYIDSVADFWNESSAVFESTANSSDQEVIEMLSQTEYPNGLMVDVDTIMGNTQRDAITGTLTEADSYLIRFGIPWSNVTKPFEAQALNRMLLLREEWKDRGDEFTFEILSYSSYSNEFARAIAADLWLLPIAFAVVALFTVLFAFGKYDKVKSRGLLGIGAVVTIVASIMTSFGLLFCIGIPFTTQTIMVPFLMFGIGLDDAFIIYGSYNRRSHITNIQERIHSTMEDVGVSIFLTSLTSMLAFVLGSFSKIPAVSWLCLYAFPCIGIDFIYQITFFVALVTLDEQRIQQGRMDYCTCITVRPPSEGTMTNTNRGQGQEEMEADNDDDDDDQNMLPTMEEEKIHFADRFMMWWSGQLLKKQVQTMALFAFVALMAISVYWATQLQQEFNFVDLVPQDSYVKDYFSALHTYTTRDGADGFAIFRHVDQSDPLVQSQMFAYLDDLVEKGNVDEPVYFWLRDFQLFAAEEASKNGTFQDLSFDEQVQDFLSIDTYDELYNYALGISEDTGEVLESRVKIRINYDIQDSKASTEMLSNMRSISASQPINQNTNDLKFFTYAGEYHLYEFYNQVIQELIFTSVMSVLAVCVIALFFIPHWTAVLFVFPFISFLYVNMLGFLYISGVQINAISYVTLVMSIGLMIDYIMHILMRYYDSAGSRQQRIQETMSSMGASIFLGAASTFLGVMCLSLSTSDVLRDIFVAVVGLITFGVLHGLIFLPIALSHFGPQAKQDDVLLDEEEDNFNHPKFSQQQLVSPSSSVESTVQNCPTPPLNSPFSFTSDQTYEV